MPEFASPQKKPAAQKASSGLLQRQTKMTTTKPPVRSFGVGHGFDLSKVPATTKADFPHGSFYPRIDPKHPKPEVFLEELEKLVDQQNAYKDEFDKMLNDPKTPQWKLEKARKKYSGHQEKVTNSLNHINDAVDKKLVSKKIARAARRIAKKAVPFLGLALILLPEESMAEHDPSTAPQPQEKDAIDYLLEFLDAIDPFHVPPAY